MLDGFRDVFQMVLSVLAKRIEQEVTEETENLFPPLLSLFASVKQFVDFIDWLRVESGGEHPKAVTNTIQNIGPAATATRRGWEYAFSVQSSRDIMSASGLRFLSFPAQWKRPKPVSPNGLLILLFGLIPSNAKCKMSPTKSSPLARFPANEIVMLIGSMRARCREIRGGRPRGISAARLRSRVPGAQRGSSTAASD